MFLIQMYALMCACSISSEFFLSDGLYRGSNVLINKMLESNTSLFFSFSIVKAVSTIIRYNVVVTFSSVTRGIHHSKHLRMRTHHMCYLNAILSYYHI